ncbi:MAG: alpha/beta hydrolase [Candidatus Pacebacteria bacterium]|nr:alpha/beta hydrolase [Candidatus Paceibacterota bacterium]
MDFMKNVFIIHGAYGSSKENWFPWLKDELERNNYQVFVPNFPTPAGQSLGNWLKVIGEYGYYINKETIFIGHILGPVFILSVLEKLEKPIKACFFVSGFVDFLGNEDFDVINKSFVDKDFDWEKIKGNCKNFHIYYSDNGPYVSVEKA